MKILWTSYVEAKSLYACKSFSKATMNKIDADTYEITGKENWLKMIDTGYKKAFSNKYPKKGTMESKWKSIPLFPSERAVARSLLQVVLIITGKGEKYGLNRDNFLPVTSIDRNTRMNTKTILERSLGSSNHHQKGLSIMDIQKNLVEDYFKENPDSIHQEERAIKDSIYTYIRNLNTKERKMKMEILQGEFIHRD